MNSSSDRASTIYRGRVLRRAAWIGIIGNAILASMKMVAGLIAGSLAVIGDGIDSTTDVAFFIMTLITARIIVRPLSPKYPYGYNKAETIATKLLAFFIFFVGAQLMLATLRMLAFPEKEVHGVPEMLAIYVTLVSIAGKIILARWQFRIGRRIQSDLIVSNARNMQNDIITSLSVLAGLFFTFVLKLPVLDLITALLVSLWIMKTAVGIFLESNVELMDGIKDIGMYEKVIDAVSSVEGAHNPHRIRIRKSAQRYVIALDIEVDHQINIVEAHRIARNTEQAIRRRIDNIYDILIHIEPFGNIEQDEEDGVTPQMLDQDASKTNNRKKKNDPKRNPRMSEE